MKEEHKEAQVYQKIPYFVHILGSKVHESEREWKRIFSLDGKTMTTTMMMRWDHRRIPDMTLLSSSFSISL
jgi:hypothetical protein